MSGTAVCPTCGAPVGTGARFCATCGTPLAESVPEERKLATILFADVIGSTDLGEQLDPERLRALLQDYFSAMAAVVDAWSGTIEKYIGDAILAVWGVPTAREDDPVRALHAAHGMVAELERINPDLERRHGVRLGVRIGVNTGEVLAPVGAQRAGQFLVSGDAVNVAARLEQAAEPGTVLVGERTWSGARHAFEFGDALELEVKGKRAPVTARALRAALDAAAGDDSQRPLQAPMLGRERELSTLVGLLDEVVEDGAPRLVLVSGPAGMGKSRMLREFIATAKREQPQLLVLRGRCLATGHGITFWALGEVLRLLCGISLDEPAESAADKLRTRVAGPLAQVGLSSDEIARTIAALAVSANLALSDDPLRGLGPEEMADEMAHAWPRLLTGIARNQPVTIVIEDIHWADQPMLRMLEALATRSRGPLLVIATARPEFLEMHAGFGSGADLSMVSLRALSEAQSAQLIADLLGSADLPGALIEEIQHKADGNPFFLEEIVQRLIDEGALVATTGGEWQATARAASVQLPDTIYALLAARIDALPTDEKRLLQEAAVVGRIFWPGALAAGVATEDVLRRAERRGLVSLRPTSTIENESEYIFRHVLIRDVAYNSVPRKRRALAHADTGRWIEDLAGERAEEFAELIAFHFSAAVSGADADLGWSGNEAEREDIRRRAFAMLISAGTTARRRFAIDKALELHGQARDLASGTLEIVRANEELGDDHEGLFHGDEAVAHYLLAIDALEPTPDNLERRARLVAKAAQMAVRWGAFRETPPIDRIQELIQASLAGPVGDAVRAPLLIASAGLARARNGSPVGAGRVILTAEEMPDFDLRIESVQEGLRIAQQLDDSALQFMAYDLLSILFQATRDEQRYRATCEQALSLLDRLPSHRQQVDLLVSVAGARVDAGRYELALEAAEEAFARSIDLSPHERMHAAWEIYRASEPLGNWQRIVELLPWYSAAAVSEGDVTCAAVRAGPALGGTILVRLGERDHADELVSVAVQGADSGTFGSAAIAAAYAAAMSRTNEAGTLVGAALERTGSGFLATGAPPMIETLIELKRYDDLVRFLPVALDQSDANVLINPSVSRAEGVLALQRNDPDAAATHLRRALVEFETLAVPFEIARTRVLLARVVDTPERSTLLASAASEFERLGARPYADLARRSSEAGVSSD